MARSGSRHGRFEGPFAARIFCVRKEAELLAISGYYRIAEDMDANLRSQPVQAWLDDGDLMIAALE
jgi:septum site-determining protein MinC